MLPGARPAVAPPPDQVMIQSLYDFLYIDNSLKVTGLLLGSALLAGHLAALLQPRPVQDFLTTLPRSRPLGLVLLTIAAAWALLLTTHMDMGEFYTWRPRIQLIVIIGFVLVVRYVDDFLSVRAIGCLMLLAATPVLEAAFLKQPTSRLLLPALAYAWILVGMFWVGMPYLMRDKIAWVTRTPVRWLAACALGAGYGAAMLVCALLYY